MSASRSQSPSRFTDSAINTSIALGVYRERELLATFRIATDQDNLADEYGMLVLALLRSRGIDPAQIGAAAMSSTVPPLIQTFQLVCERYFDVEPLVVGVLP